MSDYSLKPGKPSICAIMPAYNEERSIGSVLQVLMAADFLSEIIVVDDGSQDLTAAIVRAMAEKDRRIRLLQHGTNLGKGQAVFNAWAATTAPYLILLDADLHALKPAHLAELVSPILDRRADMTLGLFWGGHIETDLSHWATPFLTGQRGLRSEMLRYVSRDAAAGYGFEIALTIAAHQQAYRVRRVTLRGVWHPPSEAHRGGLDGLAWRGHMYGQILRAWYIATRDRYPSARAFFSSILKS